MRIEQPRQLLTAMDRVEGVIDVERDAFGNLVKELAIKIDHGAADAQQRASIGQVFRVARWSIANTARDRTALDRALS